jgi:hypothetical protein
MRKKVALGICAALALVPAAFAGDKVDPDLIKQRVCEIKDSDSTAWRKIPWAASLLEARKLSAAEDKPIFLFTLDGNLDTGRC